MRVEFCGLFLAILTAGCSGPYATTSASTAQRGPAAAVSAARAQLGTVPEIVSATGELFAEDVTTVSPKVPGRLVKLHVDLGSRVSAGEVIAEIERVDYEVRHQQAEALVEQTRAKLGLRPGAGDEVDPVTTATVREATALLEEARLNFGRVSQLVQQGILSKSDFDRAQAAIRQAEARHQAALEEIYQARAQLMERRAQLMIARKDLDETTVRAPITGAVTKRHTSVGEYLNTGAPLVTVVRAHPIRLRLEIPERHAAKVRLRQRVEVRLENSAHRAGSIVRLSPALDAQSRSLLVEAEIPNEDGVLRPGSFAEGTITVDPEARGITIPAAATMSFAGVSRVFVIENNALADRPVRVGRKLPGDRVEILSGLRAGELVAAQVNDRMSHGQAVEVR